MNDFFAKRIEACIEAGIAREAILLDPGFGFGKTLEHNYHLLAHLQELAKFDLPLLIGLSRKSMIGNLLERSVDNRLAGSLAGAMLAAQRGAHIIRYMMSQRPAMYSRSWQQPSSLDKDSAVTS